MFPRSPSPHPLAGERPPGPPRLAGLESPTQPFLSMPFFVIPPGLGSAAVPGGYSGLDTTGEGNEAPARMLTVILRSSGEKERDVRRFKRIHGLLVSCPGHDKFSLLVFEGGKRFLLEFPNETTGITIRSDCPRDRAGRRGEFHRRADQNSITYKKTPAGGLFYCYSSSRSRRCGKRITSRIEWLSVSSMVSRSMPMPKPPLGGMPYDMARK